MERPLNSLLRLTVLIAVAGAPLPAQVKPIQFASNPSATPVFPPLVLTVNSYGVSPSKIVRKQGPFVLLILNTLDKREETFSITKDTDSKSLLDIQTHDNEHRAATTISLEPGNYVLRFTNNPKLSVPITITP